MNAMLTPAQIAEMRIHSESILAELVTKEAHPKRRGPWNRTDAARKRKIEQRARIRAKMAYLCD